MKAPINLVTLSAFLSSPEITMIYSELGSKLTRSNSNEIDNLQDLRNAHRIASKAKDWPNIYDSLKCGPIIGEYIADKFIKEAKRYIKDPFLINYGVRIMEIASTRTYPFHQEYYGIDNQFLTFWVALNDIGPGEGGLLIANCDSELEHEYNEVGYPILLDQERWMKESKEYIFKSGDALLFSQLSPHATSPKISGESRWALIYRIGGNFD